jgi:hypothetical protein
VKHVRLYKNIKIVELWRKGPIGAMVRIFAYCARGRGFDSRTVQTFVCINMSVCTRSGRFLCKVCMYLQIKVCVYIYPLSRIYNTILVSAYFGLDKSECECECLVYLLLLLFI